MDKRLSSLVERLSRPQSALLAYSGGLDSSLVFWGLAQTGIRLLAVTGVSRTTPAHDLEDARRLALELGAPHRVIETGELEREGFLANSPQRCFHCKDDLFARLRLIADTEGYEAIHDGTTADDLSDHRPGLRAGRIHGIESPLAELGLTKQDVRAAARSAGLWLWDKPSSPCLSSRVPYGVRITPEALGRIAQAEGYLRSLGFENLRVRDREGEARIELPEQDMQRVFELRASIAGKLLSLGYTSVGLDLEGLVSGKLNRGIAQKKP